MKYGAGRPSASGSSGIRDYSASGIRDCGRNSVCFRLTLSSRLGLRTEISARNRREIAHNFVACLFILSYAHSARPAKEAELC